MDLCINGANIDVQVLVKISHGRKKINLKEFHWQLLKICHLGQNAWMFNTHETITFEVFVKLLESMRTSWRYFATSRKRLHLKGARWNSTLNYDKFSHTHTHTKRKCRTFRQEPGGNLIIRLKKLAAFTVGKNNGTTYKFLYNGALISLTMY